MKVEKILLAQDVLAQIISVVLSFKKPEKIVIFGSRARKRCKDTSDIDLAIFSKDFSDTDINLLKDQLEEKVKTPLKFDLVHFEDIEKKDLKKNILTEGKVIYP